MYIYNKCSSWKLKQSSHAETKEGEEEVANYRNKKGRNECSSWKRVNILLIIIRNNKLINSLCYLQKDKRKKR